VSARLSVFVGSVQKELEDERLIIQNLVNAEYRHAKGGFAQLTTSLFRNSNRLIIVRQACLIVR